MKNPWKILLTIATGQIEAQLLARIEYLEEENRVLRDQLTRRLDLTDPERVRLAKKAMAMSRDLMEATVSIVRPATILRWHRELIRRKWDTSDLPRKPGRPRKERSIEELVEQFAKENLGWGYDRLMGAIKNLGYEISDQTVGNILKRLGLRPTPDRTEGLSWQEFIHRHQHVIWATDFFAQEVWTATGLRTIYVLFFIHLETRRVVLAGMTANPHEDWMMQVARNLTWDGGALENARYLVHDRDTKYSKAFGRVFETKELPCEMIKLPARSPNLNAHAERFVRTIKDECLNHLILFGERQLRYVVTEFLEHYHSERNHQGRDNAILFPGERAAENGKIVRHQRLGGLLNYYHRDAA